MVGKTITMPPEQWKQVEALKRKMGYDSTAAALRRIVTEWWELRGKALVGTGELLLTDLEEARAETP